MKFTDLNKNKNTEHTHTNDVDKQSIDYIDNCISFIKNEKQHTLTMIICLYQNSEQKRNRVNRIIK